MFNKYLFSKFSLRKVILTLLLMVTTSLHGASDKLTQSNIQQGPVYIQLSGTKDQVATEETYNHPTTVVMNNIESKSGFNYDSDKNEIKILQDGVYFIMASFQSGAREITGNIIKGADLYFWFEKNGNPIPNSSAWVFASPNARSKYITDQLLQPLKAGDLLTVKFSSSSPGMGIIAFPATEYRPASTGVAFSMYKIN